MSGFGIRAVFFDVGGTLSWVEPSADVIWSRTLQDLGYHFTPEEVVRRSGVRGPEINRSDIVRALSQVTDEKVQLPRNREEEKVFFRRFDEKVLERLGISPKGEILDEISRRFERDLKKHLFDDTVEALSTVERMGYSLGVISNASHDLSEGLRKNGLARFFKSVTYSFEVGVEKPDPKIFRVALERMGVAPEEAVHVGDNHTADVMGARGVGITPILLDRKGTSEFPDCVVINRLTELPERLSTWKG